MNTLLSFETLLEQFIHHVPEYTDVLEKQQAIFGDEDTQYLVLGKPLVEFVYQMRSNEDVVRRVFDFIEQCAASDDSVLVEFVQMGFLDDLITSEQDVSIMIPYMGQNTQQLYQEIKAWQQAQADKAKP